jgi:serine/threonine-protein kinase
MKVCSVCQRCFDDAVFSCIEHTGTELSSIGNGHPEMVAGYRLDRLLDGGGIAVSYLARHINSGRQCLVKTLCGTTARRDDFLLDSRTAASSFDPNIVDIYESGSLENGDLYLVTEQISGRSLRELLDAGGIDLLTAVNIIRQAAEAVHSLHLKGIIHRAIRPENILISSDDAVHLTNADFGGLLEHLVISDKFMIDAAVSELRYFAPEQFSGKESSIKTDVYSLGIVFYEMLTGRPPFQADTAAALIEMHRTQRPADVTIDDFDLRMLITHTLMESLNKHPENRQSSSNAFARQLRHVEQLATHVSTPPPAVGVPISARSAAAPSKPLLPPEKAKDVELERIPITDVLVPQSIIEAPITISHVPVAEHTAPPSESRLGQFRRRLKRQRHEHQIDSAATNDAPIENSIPQPVEELPAIVSIEMPAQEIEVEVRLQAAPTESKRSQDIDDTEVQAKLTQPILAPPVRPPKDIVITNPRKHGLRNIVSTRTPNRAHCEPDEITAVTARARPIRIAIGRQEPANLSAVAAFLSSSADSLFFPPSFRGSTALASDEGSSMFSGFYVEASDRGSMVPRVLKVGGLVIAIASLVLIGKQFTGELRSEAAPATINSMRSVSKPAQGPLAEVQYMPQRINETTMVTSTAVPEKTSEELTNAKKSADTLLKSHSASTKDKTSSAVDASRTKSPPDLRPSKAPNAVTAKMNSRTQPPARATKTESKPQFVWTPGRSIPQNKPGATTRPRVVANPRP